MKKLLLLSALAALVFAIPAAYAADTEFKSETTVSHEDDGSATADTTVTSTDAAGTDRKEETEVKIDQDENGDYKKTTEETSKVDPKGLFNTTKVKTKHSIKKKNGKLTTEHKKEVNGDVVEDSKTEVDVPSAQ